LDIENYQAAPNIVAQTIIDLKASINSIGTGPKLIVVSPECGTVYQGSSVPAADEPGTYYNYFVPIINLADFAIDYYQPQAYNDWEDSIPGGTLQFYQDVYLHWRNLKSLCNWCTITPNFNGVDGNKLVIGLLASPQAGVAGYYGGPEVIQSFIAWLQANNYPLNGFMMWDSHWDTVNGLQISNAIKG